MATAPSSSSSGLHPPKPQQNLSPYPPTALSPSTNTQFLNVPSNNPIIFRSQSLRSVPRRKQESQLLENQKSHDVHNKENSPVGSLNRGIIGRSLSTKSYDHGSNLLPAAASQNRKQKKSSKNIPKDKPIILPTTSQGVFLPHNEGTEGLLNSIPVSINRASELNSLENSTFDNLIIFVGSENEIDIKKESLSPITPTHLPPLPEIALPRRVKIQRSQSIHRYRPKETKRQYSSDRKSTHKLNPSKHRSQSFSQSSGSVPKSVRPTNLRRCTTTNNVQLQRSKRSSFQTASSVLTEEVSNIPISGHICFSRATGSTVAPSIRWKLAQDKMNQRSYEERRRKRLSLL